MPVGNRRIEIIHMRGSGPWENQDGFQRAHRTDPTVQMSGKSLVWVRSMIFFFGQPHWETNSMREGPCLVPSVSPARKVSKDHWEGALELPSGSLHVPLHLDSSPVWW